MGNTASHAHESLDKGFTRGTFGDVKNTVGFFVLFFCSVRLFWMAGKFLRTQNVFNSRLFRCAGRFVPIAAQNGPTAALVPRLVSAPQGPRARVVEAAPVAGRRPGGALVDVLVPGEVLGLRGGVRVARHAGVRGGAESVAGKSG